MKTEEILLLGGAAYLAYMVLTKPKPLTPAQQLTQWVNTLFKSGGGNVPLGNQIASPSAGVLGMAPSNSSLVFGDLMFPDNPAATGVAFDGNTSIGMPVVPPDFNNNAISAPITDEPTGIPATDLQNPQAWDEGGAQYIGANPPGGLTGGAMVGWGLERVDPSYALQPFEFFTNEGGQRYVSSALSGERIKYLAYAGD